MDQESWSSGGLTRNMKSVKPPPVAIFFYLDLQKLLAPSWPLSSLIDFKVSLYPCLLACRGLYLPCFNTVMSFMEMGVCLKN